MNKFTQMCLPALTIVAILAALAALTSCKQGLQTISQPIGGGPGGAQGGDGEPTPTPAPTPNPTPILPKYFGYYASQMDGVALTSDIEDLKDKSNFVHIHSGNLKEKLDKAREHGMKVMISLSWATFGADMRLQANWQQNLVPIFEIVDQNLDIIIANYVLDEPYMNGRDHGVSDADMLGYLETLGQYFKAKYPDMPLAVIFSGGELKRGVTLPQSFDWFGMDCYDSFDYCNKRSIPWYYGVMKDQIKKLEEKDGRIRWLMGVPAAGYEQGQLNKEQNHLEQVAKYRNFMKSEPKMRIMMPFIWQTFGTAQTGGWTGARDSAKLRAPFIKMYSDFMNGTL